MSLTAIATGGCLRDFHCFDAQTSYGIHIRALQFAYPEDAMEFFKVEISETAELLSYDALSTDERSALFRGMAHDPETHDIFRVLMAVVERDAPSSWNERQRKRKTFSLVDRVLIDMRPKSKGIRIAGMFPTSIAADGTPEFDFEAEAGARIMEVADARLKFAGPIKNWWRKRRPLVVANRTDRMVQWVYSRDWLDGGQQCQGEFLIEAPKAVAEADRVVSCFVDFKEKTGRAVERARRSVRLPT